MAGVLLLPNVIPAKAGISRRTRNLALWGGDVRFIGCSFGRFLEIPAFAGMTRGGGGFGGVCGVGVGIGGRDEVVRGCAAARPSRWVAGFGVAVVLDGGVWLKRSFAALS